MSWVNYLVTSKFAKSSEGHLPAQDLAQAIQDHDGGEAYYNHFDVTTDGLGVDEGVATFKGASGPARPALGLVGFDFDHEDAAQSLNDVIRFINYLKLKNFYVAFSGSKGFHVSIPFEYFGLEADADLPKTLNKLAHHLKPAFKTLDTSVYNIGRKFRALNSKHPKTGLYKTIINGLGSRDMDGIKEFCKTRHTRGYDSFGPIEPDENLVRLVADCKVSAAYDKSKAGTAIEPTKLESFDGKICIKRLIEARCPDGERNTTALIIINDLFKTGKHKDYCYEVVLPWASRSGFPTDEVTTMVEAIYAGDRFYNHGCLEPIKSAKCSAKCPLWSKLAKDKRPVPVDAPKTAFKDHEKTKKIPATEFVYTWCRENNLDVTLSNLWFVAGVSMPLSDVVMEIYRVYNSATSHMVEYRTVTQAIIEATLSNFEKRMRAVKLLEMRDRIRYTGENDEVEKFLTAVLPEVRDVDRQVLKHWIWLVKRNIWSGNLQHHMMPIFTGRTGSGKSRAVEALCAPLNDVVDTADVSILGDDRQDFRLMTSFIMYFDEMAKANKVDVESLKKKITADYLTYRVLGTNAKNKGKKVCSFIGTSNYEVIDIIKDPTSVRRYWDFKCKNRIDWNAINTIDYLKLWQGIDEDRDDIYLTDMKAVKLEQEKFREMDSVEEFLTENGLFVDDEGSVEVSSPTLYLAYVDWLEMQNRGRYAFSTARFGRTLKTYLEANRKTRGVFYKVSKRFSDVSAASNTDFIL